MRYVVVIESTASGYSAYLPDLPGCVATGRDRAEVERRIGEAVILHVAGLREDGLPVPEPRSQIEYVEVAA
jgi:predicted RNase H-like HicB family nuclease